MTEHSVGVPIVELSHASVDFSNEGTTTSAVHDVSFSVREGEIFGIVGESGCGKSTLAQMVMGLLPETAQVSGSVRYEGKELLGQSEEQWRRLRGNRMSFISQDPRAALDAVTPIGDQVAETIRAHQKVSRREARALAITALAETGITHAEERYGDPPHRFSGGMCQRVVIAAALANQPGLLIADEPTTALDVTIQAQILALLRGLRERLSMTVILITHDMGVIAQMCDRVGVMYAGELVEVAGVKEIFAQPGHPYTDALFGAIPSARRQGGQLQVIPGQVPDLSSPLAGCRFKERCAYRIAQCDEAPALTEISPSQAAACWKRGNYRPAAPPGVAIGAGEAGGHRD
ncbi:MAG: ABC transporter ATP-binding protein [Actinomycetota bacterium]|nr:ABC transporter ATP-binding protein [Actinomycetota bacterium]